MIQFLRNRTLTAVINIFHLLTFINLTFRTLLNTHFQKYRYNFENYTYITVFNSIIMFQVLFSVKNATKMLDKWLMLLPH